ncbi:PREDICTED: transcription factor EMB1444-like isoform X2 [Populus euphratica]|uniref:Transcription factor EMB1444-like isoform X2 n=1 Tax=Populus euphratica TaxID=75702 RepID=A0AAJ6T9D5_POPEU|nr:PREDICTED: transcription factor EMB1444-like isoform X2 [Populus euphratica]
MGTTDLRQLLESLCNNSDWKYAVLWKMGHGSPMILTWEEGYFDCPKPREPLQTISSDVYCNGGNDLVSSLRDASASNANFGGHQLELVVADMLHLQYPLGEGVVGEVAYTGDHFWLSFNSIFSSEMSKNLVPEFPEEWLLQFASGIKTILLVPVLPHGVVQLGSFDEVAEDIQIVAYIKGRFNDLHSTREHAVPLTLKREFKAQSTLISCPVEQLNATSAISISQVKSEDSNYSIPVNSVKLHKDEQPEDFKCESKNNTPSPIFADVSPPSEYLSASQPGMVENMVEQSSGGMDANEVYHINRQSFLSFPKGSELHKVLGPPFLSQTNEKTWEPSLLVEDSCKSSNFIFSEDRSARIEPSLFATEGEVEFLLEPVAGNSYSSSDNASSNRSHSLKSSERLSGHLLATSQNQFQTRTLVGDDLAPWSHLASVCISGSGKTDITVALDSMMSTIFDQEQQGKDQSYKHPWKGQKMSNVARRRARPGENQKPRPRDRQLIQDRVKELRELVPNGSKCSIDGLLDQTIKHMQYLRSVTDQAEKLRQWVHQEVADRKNCRSSETNVNIQSGKSWAFEFGNDLQICPIVVEDLAYPGHLLIEMLCNDRGVFLEIAQVIRSLDLTILKGVMESRLSNTWAHFIVEACKGFHRLDIFWPLMQLLQRKRSSISGKI